MPLTLFIFNLHHVFIQICFNRPDFLRALKAFFKSFVIRYKPPSKITQLTATFLDAILTF